MKKLWALLFAMVFVAGSIFLATTATAFAENDVVMNVNGTDYTNHNEGWSKAIEIAEGGTKTTVTLKADWNAVNGAFDYSKGTDNGRLYINDSDVDMTIDLNGYTINRGLASAQSDGQVFEINDGKLTITDSVGTGKITGGNNTGNGGAFFVNFGTLHIKGGEISGNHATNGGGIYGDDQNDVFIYIDGGKITNNTADYGAGIYMYEGYLTINGGEISGNTAEYYGGGVYWYSDNDMVINGGKISGNTAYRGGGVYMRTDITMNGGEISGNNATWGGGIAEESGDIYLTGGKISGNKADYGAGILWLGDGEPYLGNTITGNVAKEFGGGVYIYSTYVNIYTGGAAVVSGNSSGLGADNILLSSSANNFYNGSRCDFDGATDITTGASIGIRCLYDFSNTTTLSYRTCEYDAMSGQYFFSDDSAYSLIALPNLGDSAHPYKLTLIAKKSNTPLMEVTVNGVTNTFYDFDIAWSTAIDASTYAPTTVKLLADWNAENGAFNYTNGTNNGRLYLNNSNIDLTIDLNGYIINRGLTEAVSSGQVFEINDGKLTIIDSVGTGKITGGNNTGFGGAFFVDYGSLYLRGGEITGNHALKGGGIYGADQGDVFINIYGGKITNNTAENGAGIYMYEGYLTINDGEISGNKAESCGGGIYWESDNTIAIRGGKISGNSALQGGGIYSKTDIIINGGEISGNNASWGGGVVGESGNGYFVNGKITDNKAKYAGGILWLEESSNLYLGNTITGNAATEWGGGVYVYPTYANVYTGGTVTVSGNSSGLGADNLLLSSSGNDLYNGSKCTFSASTPLAAGAKIGVRCFYDVPYMTALCADNCGFDAMSGQYFFSDDSSMFISNSANGSHPYKLNLIAKVSNTPLMEVIVNGTSDSFYNFDAGWDVAVNAAETGLPTTIKLLADWVAADGKFSGIETYYGSLHIDDSDIDLTIDLNGYSIDRNLNTATSKGYVFRVTGGAKLTIIDSSSTGKGKITGGNNTEEGGAFYIDYGKLYLNSGEINGNSALSGGGIYSTNENDSFVYINGGKICNNTATNGGGIFMEEGFLYVDAGEISDNTATHGGGIYWNSENDLFLTGGKISDNKANEGGGVYATDWGNIYIGGNIVVNDNKGISGFENKNFYLEDDDTCLNNVPNKPLSEGAYIGLSAGAENFCVSAVNSGFTENSIKYLHSDLPTKVVRAVYRAGYGDSSYQIFYNSISAVDIPAVKFAQRANEYVTSASVDSKSKTVKVYVDVELKNHPYFASVALSELVKVTLNKSDTELVGLNEIRNFALDQEYKLIGSDGTYEFWTATIDWICTQNADENGDYICDHCGEFVLSDSQIIGYDAQTQEATVFVAEAGKYTLVFADYEGNMLENADAVEFDFEEGINVVPQKTDFVLANGDKVMLWYDMINLAPACSALTIK